MSANQFGEFFRITTFGESHGPALGVVIDGCPAGVEWDEALLTRELARRRPGQALTSARAESDQVEVLSGVFEGKTLGTPIALLTRNHDARSEDYEAIRRNPRPGHADDVWLAKFGHTDPRGGGRSSGRETVARVMAGAVAKLLVKTLEPQIEVLGFASSIGALALSGDEHKQAISGDQDRIDACAARFPAASADAVTKLLSSAQTEGQSHGGVAEIWVRGVPQGLGQPVFRKFKSDLAQAMLSVGATSSIEIGDGFDAASAEGVAFHRSESDPYGGIRGGITTGEPISFRVGFKPTSSVLDVAKKGRHDPCIVPRAIPVLQAMTWIVIADHLLWRRKDVI